jgi:hypothetical protein
MPTTKNFKQIKQKLKKLSNKEQADSNLIIRNGNTFVVYDEYEIKKNKHEFEICIRDSNEFVANVYNSSTAISWCNAHKGNNSVLARNIIETDRAIEFLSNDIAYTKILIKLKSTPHTKQSILLARLTEYLTKQLQLKLNLHKYIQRSKQIKDKGFSNEFTTPNTAKHRKKVR